MGDMLEGNPDVLIALEGDFATYVRQAAAEANMSHTAVVKQALRLYQLHLRRLADGETFSYSGDAERARAFRGPQS